MGEKHQRLRHGVHTIVHRDPVLHFWYGEYICVHRGTHDDDRVAFVHVLDLGDHSGQFVSSYYSFVTGYSTKISFKSIVKIKISRIIESNIVDTRESRNKIMFVTKIFIKKSIIEIR